jgi:transposase, IS5 family
MKITTRCGERAVAQLIENLLEKADAAHVVKLDKVRAETTVVPANVADPTDLGLLDPHAVVEIATAFLQE